MFEAFLSAWKNLKKKKMRTFLTSLGISIGVASVLLVGSISQFGSEAIKSELDSLGMGGFAISTVPTSGAALSTDELYIVRDSEVVEEAAPITLQSTKITIHDTKTDALLWGMDAAASRIVSLKLIHGRMLTESDVKSTANVCLVDEAYAKSMYARSNIVGKYMTILSGETEEQFQIVGVVKAGSGLLQNMIGSYIPTFIYIPYTTAQMMKQHYTLDQIAVKVKEGEDADKAGKDILTALEKYSGITNGYTANTLARQKEQISSMLRIITLILIAVGAVSLLVASLSIMTVMTVSVNERTREIGIKKAIGASRNTILQEFMLEALLLSILGCISGVVIGYTISIGIAGALQIPFRPYWQILILSVGFSTLSGIIFGVYPAIQASRLKPVDALRAD